jgi:alpha-tubulin suppressor-like RCC1 family protein
MITSIQNRATLGEVMVLGFLLATLLMTMVLSAAAPAGAAVPSGKAFAWGSNFYGQLGTTNKTSRSTPGAVFGLSNVKFISGGAAHSLAILEGGEVKSWGWNYYGQLGIGITGESITVPVAVKNLTNVDGGHSFTLAVTQ